MACRSLSLRSSQIDGLPAATRRVRTFEYNVPLAADLFNWPG